MERWNPADYLRARSRSDDLTPQDLDSFEMYMFQMRLSMNSGHERLAALVNNPWFFALPKHIQAKAFTSLNGQKFRLRFTKVSTNTRDDNMKSVEKVMALFNCGWNDANSYIANGIIDMARLNEIYDMKFNPEKFIKENGK